jgi:hypothetical protein
MKNRENLARPILCEAALVLLIIFTIFLNANYMIKSIKAENSIEEINFDSPFNNTIDLGTPFLVEYDNTTGLKPLGIRTAAVGSEDFAITFSGFGVINHANDTIRYDSNGSGIYVTSPDGTVYQKGIIELKQVKQTIPQWLNMNL